MALMFAALAQPATAAPTFIRRAFPLPQPILGVASLDVNGDGRLDVVAAGETKVWAMLAPDWRVVELADTTRSDHAARRRLRPPRRPKRPRPLNLNTPNLLP